MTREPNKDLKLHLRLQKIEKRLAAIEAMLKDDAPTPCRVYPRRRYPRRKTGRGLPR